MKSLRVTLPDELESRFEAYLEASGTSPEEVVRDALRRYLENERGTVHLDGEAHPAPEKPLRFTPAEHGSGRGDMSVNHDRYLAEG